MGKKQKGKSPEEEEMLRRRNMFLDRSIEKKREVKLEKEMEKEMPEQSVIRPQPITYQSPQARPTHAQ